MPKISSVQRSLKKFENKDDDDVQDVPFFFVTSESCD